MKPLLPNIFVLGLKWLHLAAAQTYCLSVLTIRLSMPDWRTGHAQSNAPSHSPTRGFPYTNTLAAARLIRPRTQCIHPLSVRRGGGRQRVRAHLGGNDSPLKADLRCARASQIFSRCLQSGAQDRVIALAHSTGSSPLTGDASSDCASVKAREWAAWLMGIQSDSCSTPGFFWPLCRTPTLPTVLFTSSLIITESCWILLFLFECSKLWMLTVVNIRTIKCALHNRTQGNGEAHLSEVYFL